jgi:hypothetical protein
MYVQYRTACVPDCTADKKDANHGLERQRGLLRDRDDFKKVLDDREDNQGPSLHWFNISRFPNGLQNAVQMRIPAHQGESVAVQQRSDAMR